MKIREIETFVVDAGWRPLLFVAVRTDEGITGYGEVSDGRNPYGIAGTIDDFEPLLIGRDPRHIESIYWELYRVSRQNPGGIAAKAIAGIELALWDVKGKAAGMPVYEFFGGPMRDEMDLSYCHAVTTRARQHELVGAPPIDSYEAVTEFGKEVVEMGFKALKTNVIIPGTPARGYGSGSGFGPTDQTIPVEILRRTEQLLAALSDGTGPDVEIAIDLNFHYKPEAAKKVCKVCEQFTMMWIEFDMYEPEALREIKDSTSVSVTSGESLYGIKGYRPYLEKRSMDTIMVDVVWNGFSRSRDIAMVAESFEVNIAPHNYYSPLATNMALNLCAVVPNVRILEVEVDEVPWMEELCGVPVKFKGGKLAIPTAPGWGVDLNEDFARSKVWERGRGPGFAPAGLGKK